MTVELDRGLAAEGFAVALMVDQQQLLGELRREPADVVVIEARRESFADLLRAVVRTAPKASVYLIDSGAVFCRYPMRGRDPDIVAALGKAGVAVSDRLFPPAPNPMVHAVPEPESQREEAFLV
jgi:hypothetical protein